MNTGQNVTSYTWQTLTDLLLVTYTNVIVSDAKDCKKLSLAYYVY
jgi:hypothetical protein